MDQKHREYCIKLGNPYMKKEVQNIKQEASSSWNNYEIPVENNDGDDWLKNSKKFTN